MQEKHYKHNCPPENYVRKGCFSDHNTLSTYPNKRLVERIIRRSPKQKTLSKDEALYFYELAYLLSQTNNPNDAIGEWVQVSMYGSVLEAILRTLLEERYCDNWLSLDLYFEDFSKPRNPNPTNLSYTIADYRDDRIETFSKDLKSLNRSWNTSKHAKALIPSEEEEKLYQRTEKPEDCYRWLCEFILYTSDIPIPEEYKKAYGGKAFDYSLMRDLLNKKSNSDIETSLSVREFTKEAQQEKGVTDETEYKPPLPPEPPVIQKRMPIFFLIDAEEELGTSNLLAPLSEAILDLAQGFKTYSFVDIGLVSIDGESIQIIWLQPVNQFILEYSPELITNQGRGCGSLMRGFNRTCVNLKHYIDLLNIKVLAGQFHIILSNSSKLTENFQKMIMNIYINSGLAVNADLSWGDFTVNYLYLLQPRNLLTRLGLKIRSGLINSNTSNKGTTSMEEIVFKDNLRREKMKCIELAEQIVSGFYEDKHIYTE